MGVGGDSIFLLGGRDEDRAKRKKKVYSFYPLRPYFDSDIDGCICKVLHPQLIDNRDTKAISWRGERLKGGAPKRHPLNNSNDLDNISKNCISSEKIFLYNAMHIICVYFNRNGCSCSFI